GTLRRAPGESISCDPSKARLSRRSSCAESSTCPRHCRMTSPLRPNLITAIYLNSRGFGFALFEGPTAPLDWGTVEIRGKDKREKLLARVDAVFARYRPDFVVLQDMSERGTHRPHRIRRLNETITKRAEGYNLPVRFFSRNDVRRCFAYVQTVSKDAI